MGDGLADFGRDPRSSDSLIGIVYQKTQKLLTKYPGLATSGPHNSAIIINAENSRPNGSPGDVWFPFLQLESLLSPGLYAAHQKGTYPNFRQRPLSGFVQ